MSVPQNLITRCSVPVDWPTIAQEQIELLMMGIILSAVVYGSLLSLTLSYLSLLLKSSYDISRRMRIFLLVYFTFMVAISTVYMVTISIVLMSSLSMTKSESDDNCNGILARGFCITFASWGADGFMLWRCAMLYEGISRPRRIALLSVLGILALISLASGLGIPSLDGFYFFLAITAVTVFLNLITTTLITLRILYFDRYIRKTAGLESNNPYMRIITICVESSALIFVFGLIYLILYFTANHASIIPLQLLVHVYVISPLLIVYRVARGRGATIRQRLSENGTVVSTLHFEPPPQSLISPSTNEA